MTDNLVEIVRTRIDKAPISENSIPNCDVRLLLLEIERLTKIVEERSERFGFICENCQRPTHSRTTIAIDGRLVKVCVECYNAL